VLRTSVPTADLWGLNHKRNFKTHAQGSPGEGNASVSGRTQSVSDGVDRIEHFLLAT
jgi:hypothetical protein